MLVGYARVSTDRQDEALQVAALKRAGLRRVTVEVGSGAGSRPALQRLILSLRRGDVLVVWKVDRLARTLRGLLELVESLRARGVGLRSLTEPLDTGTAVGTAFLQLLGVFAELERALIAERCECGRREAMARGVRFGRRPLFTAYDDAVRLRASGVSWREVGRRLGANPETIRQALVRRRRKLLAIGAQGIG